ncbi:hypothetical protein Tco_0103644 [Tanacetum coccineum]
MYTSKDDYLINSLRFVSAKESTQIYGAILPKCLTSLTMKESKAYKTYLGYATGEVPSKVARKFKKASPSKKDSDLVPVDEEPVKKGKRLKTPAKKSASKPATDIIIREPPVETKSKRKEKEKVDVAHGEHDGSRIERSGYFHFSILYRDTVCCDDIHSCLRLAFPPWWGVTHGKGIELLSDVALTEEAQMKEVRKRSLRDFHKTHPSGSSTAAEKPPRVDTITPTVTSEGTGEKPGVLDVTEEDSSESESESWGNDEGDNNNEQDSSKEVGEQENESKEQESNLEQDEESKDDDQEEEEFYQDKESKDDEMKTVKGVVQGEGTDAEITDPQQGNENLETTQEHIVKDAYVTISTVLKKTEVPVTSSSRSSDLASKFLIFLDIPQADAEIVSPLDVHVHHEVPRTQAPTLLTIPVSVITDSSHVFTNIPQSSQTFTPPPLQATPTPLPTTGTTNPLSTLPDFSSVF